MAITRSKTVSFEDISVESLKAYLRANGYLFREQWGDYLERHSRKTGGREDNVLVPTTREIRDFDKRLLDVMDALSRQLRITSNLVLKDIVNAGYEVVRIRANEGEQSSSLGYDAAVDLLRGGFALIDASAVLAASDHAVSIIRGRRPDAVRRYLDAVRVGQTEVGSFVLTLLMPTGARMQSLDMPEGLSDGFGHRVAERFSGSIRAAEAAVRSGGLETKRDMTLHGLTSNASGAIARMVSAVGDVAITLAPAAESRSSPRFAATHFQAADLPKLREIERRLTPKDQRQPISLNGTITEFREPKGKTSGTIVLTCEIYGETRPVRLKFERAHRSIVLQAIEKKAEYFLSVSGDLVSKTGHYHLEEPQGFGLTRRGGLA